MPGWSMNGLERLVFALRITARIRFAAPRLRSSIRRPETFEQCLLGHTKIENTVRYLGVDIEDALTLAEGTEI